MLDCLIRAALEECAQTRKFPSDRADPRVMIELRQPENKGRCEHGGS